MKTARSFFIAIGIFYAVFNFVGTLPFATASFLGPMYPGIDLHSGEPVFQLLQDAWIIVGIQLGAIGLVALWGARDPLRYAAVIPVVIVTEVVDGVWDFYSITWSHEVAWMGVITIAIHLVWIAWAVVAWRALFPATASAGAQPTSDRS
ncbi:MAG: BphX family protein [Immundisolibacter sp.]|uniref:BphX family protein n=1 Tax=Immundisolibacter sp. TaxID=1934948 RepID=UPI003EE1C402